MDAPCYNCKKRTEDCHATCPKYLAYSKSRLELGQAKQKEVLTKPLRKYSKRRK